jgi:hypothetical protein
MQREQMIPDGAYANANLAGDLLVAVAFCHEMEHAGLLRGQVEFLCNRVF